ncbi:hypothetical protein AVEN_198780-1 [Araneus ventricosus]|uniref:Uncharacterized protein n=1 Tax=Araneus ventricosus TaxID=182803 RepID=A0A4Y2I5V9_ARAVE|nr:hypothetical protein AVEN_198780-1 [Araneus ventricosus]
MAELESQRTQNPTIHAPIPIWGLDARVEKHQRICLDWDLATRLENRKSAVCGHFGASVNDVPHFSTWMGGGKTSLETNGIEWSTDECPALYRLVSLIQDHFWSSQVRFKR